MPLVILSTAPGEGLDNTVTVEISQLSSEARLLFILLEIKGAEIQFQLEAIRTGAESMDETGTIKKTIQLHSAGYVQSVAGKMIAQVVQIGGQGLLRDFMSMLIVALQSGRLHTQSPTFHEFARTYLCEAFSLPISYLPSHTGLIGRVLALGVFNQPIESDQALISNAYSLAFLVMPSPPHSLLEFFDFVQSDRSAQIVLNHMSSLACVRIIVGHLARFFYEPMPLSYEKIQDYSFEHLVLAHFAWCIFTAQPKQMHSDFVRWLCAQLVSTHARIQESDTAFAWNHYQIQLAPAGDVQRAAGVLGGESGSADLSHAEPDRILERLEALPRSAPACIYTSIWTPTAADIGIPTLDEALSAALKPKP